MSAPMVVGFQTCVLPTSSVTEPVCTPPITAVSLVPLMVTVTSWLAEPSLETAVKESVIDWPTPSCWIAVGRKRGGEGKRVGLGGGRMLKKKNTMGRGGER